MPVSAGISWVCTGDDSVSGTAASFIMAAEAGEDDFSESDWAAAEKITQGLPLPAAADSMVTFLLTGLEPETGYRVTVRALDDYDNLSA